MRFRLGRSVGQRGNRRLNLQFLYLAALCLIILVLGWLQYHWIDEVSRAQKMQAKARLREEVRVLTDAFDTEITRAALVFTLPAAPALNMFDILEERWGVWNHGATWPKILSGVSLVESTGAGWRMRSVGDPGTIDFRSILSDPFSVVPPPSPGPAGSTQAEIRVPETFIHGQPYLLRPIPAISDSDGRPLTSWMIVHYNLGYLAQTVFPQLLEEYSVPDDRLEFQFRLLPNGPVPQATIVSASQFHYRGDCLLAHGLGAGLSMRISGRHEISRMLSAGRATSEFIVGGDLPLNSLIRAAGHCETPSPPPDAGLMQVVVSAHHGALSAVYLGFRRRNEILSGLVLAVLLAGLAALVVSTERARRLARLEAVVAAGISHELRTPLASLNVALDHLKNGHVQNVEQARRYGEILEAQARRLGDVVDQALAVTKLNRRNALPSPRAVSLPQMIQAGLDALAPRIREVAIDVQHDIPADLPMISADPDFVLRCVINLVENALKHAAAGGWIHVSASTVIRAKRCGVEMIVEDRGPGVPEEEFEAVFEPFYRGSSARRSRQPGSGLGLAIVKSTAEAYGGYIKLERAAPQGSSFRLFFPAANQPGSSHLPECEVQQNAVSPDTADR